MNRTNRFNKIASLIFISILFLNIVLSCTVKGCKDIVACGDSTAGEYNLLLKVRDPSRPGPQVLCIVPEGYEYTYHHPWTGKPMSFKVEHKFIGVATKGDTIPNIIKAGMAFSDAGLAYGDADTNSNWVNPTRYAWDDFDWIRYACQDADTEEEACKLMTKDAVDEMHATGVSENLFVVGPRKGFVIEADAIRYVVKEVKDFVVMQNYPKELWKSQLHRRIRIAPSFDSYVDKWVTKGKVVHLHALFGVKIVDIGPTWIVVKPISFEFRKEGNKFKFFKTGENSRIELGESKNVGQFGEYGQFRVKLLACSTNKARIYMCSDFKAWEDKMMQYIQSKHGSITVMDMINWSRLHGEDLDGLRGMCAGSRYEGAMVYKIPKESYETLSEGWFAACRPCSSIYVPVHICDTDIFDPYETGEAAELSLELLKRYGHGTLVNSFSKVEEVFFYEMEVVEEIAIELIANDLEVVSDFLTIIDMGMQRQAWLTEEMWLEAGKVSNQKNKQEIIDILDGLWEESYTFSLNKMETILPAFNHISGSAVIVDKIEDMALNICKSKIDASKAIGRQSPTAEEEYKTGRNLIKQGEYELGFNLIEKAFIQCDIVMKGGVITERDRGKIEEDEGPSLFYHILFYVLIIFLTIVIFVILLKKKRD